MGPSGSARAPVGKAPIRVPFRAEQLPTLCHSMLSPKGMAMRYPLDISFHPLWGKHGMAEHGGGTRTAGFHAI